jgi:hypothetical protein
MKFQACSDPATHHVTELDAGQPVAYHVRKGHLQTLDNLKGALPETTRGETPVGPGVFLLDPGVRQAVRNREALDKVTAHVLLALCLALLDPKPEVRIVAAFRLMQFGAGARSTTAALRGALQSADLRVRKAAGQRISSSKAATPVGSTSDPGAAPLPFGGQRDGTRGSV